MRARIALIGIGLVLIPLTAPAPPVGTFESLDRLIAGAEFIVLAEIADGPKPIELDMGVGGTFDIKIVRVLKGDAKQGDQKAAYLRDIPFGLAINGLARNRSTSLSQGLIRGQLYLLFLNKFGRDFRSPAGDTRHPDFEPENCPGDIVWIPETVPFGTIDFDLLKKKSLQEGVVYLLSHAASVQQSFVLGVDAMIKDRPPPQSAGQEPTTVLWFDGNAEEAARFYVSIFTDPACPRRPGWTRMLSVTRSGSKDSPGSAPGPILSVEFLLNYQDLLARNREPDTKSTFSGSSLILNCTSQKEIDYFWAKLSEGGKKSRGGWVTDKFGVSWQIIPSGLQEMLRTEEYHRGAPWKELDVKPVSSTAKSSERVLKALMGMEKIDIKTLEEAASQL